MFPGTFLPAMAREIVPSPWIFGWGWPVFGAAAFVSTLVSAALHRRFSNRTIWGASQIAMAVGLLLPVLFPHILSIVAAALCVGGTFMVITMAGLREVHRIATSTDVARHVAVMTAAFAVCQIIGPVFASALHDATENFAPSLITTSIFLISTVALLARADPVSPVGCTDGSRAHTPLRPSPILESSDADNGREPRAPWNESRVGCCIIQRRRWTERG